MNAAIQEKTSIGKQCFIDRVVATIPGFISVPLMRHIAENPINGATEIFAITLC